MYEVIEINSGTNSFLYTNLKTKVYKQPLVWKNNVVANFFGKLRITKTDWTIEVVSINFKVSFKNMLINFKNFQIK